MARLTRYSLKMLFSVLLAVGFICVGSRIMQLSGAANSVSQYIYKETHLNQEIKNILDAQSAPSNINIKGRDEDLFQTAPLSPIPFLVRMLNATRSNHVIKADAYARHLIDLRPRNEVARLHLANNAATRGEYEFALEQLRMLMAIDRQGRDIHLGAIANLAQNKDTWPMIETILKDRPKWGPQLLEILSSKIEDQSFLGRLYAYYPETQHLYLLQLSKRGAWETAFASYIMYLDGDELDDITTPFDDHFHGLRAPQPFNWSIDERYADLDETPGLFISFYGRGQPIIAWQTLALSPGTYNFSSTIHGESHRHGGHLSWQIRCVDDGAQIGNVDIMALKASGDVFAFTFAVPRANCAFQTLRLQGIAGAFPRTLRATIDYAMITES
ncbi:MAG: hypothetical protein AAFY34_08820 [Pseudomonadota bacterium]